MNILLLDTTNMRMEDQMYLRIQLSKFLQTLGPGEQLAVYLRNGQVTIQLQGFTADHALLTAAIHKGLPRFMPTGRQYLSDAETLHQLAIYLGQLPGRKNVLWFSGGSTAFLLANDDEMGVFNLGMVNSDLRRMYDELESSRIAVYPIDARGPTLRHNATVLGQQLAMNEEAEATGGQAFYANNGLAQSAAKVVDTDGSFYTLTYSPQDFHYDNKWHRVRVTVEGSGYRLSYRRGYFADSSNGREEASGEEKTTAPGWFHCATGGADRADYLRGECRARSREPDPRSRRAGGCPGAREEGDDSADDSLQCSGRCADQEDRGWATAHFPRPCCARVR